MGKTWEKVRDGWDVLTHRDDGAVFCETTLPFYFVLPWSKSFPVYIIFRLPMQSSWSHFPPTHCTWTRLLSSMTTTQLTWHFHRKIHENRCISCDATHATYVVFALGPLRPVYFRKQVAILICHPRNLCGMSKNSSYRYRTGVFFLRNM